MASSFKPTMLSTPSAAIPPTGNFHCKTVDNGFWYYDAMDDSKISGPTIYRHLVESAQNDVGVWDPYLQGRDATIFDTLSPSICLRILTSINQKGEANKSYHQFLNEIETIQKNKGFSLQVMGICRSTHQKASRARIPHDRFLFIDDRVFMIGSSLHYHSIENDQAHLSDVANTAIVELQDDDNREIVRNDFESYWDKTNPRCKYVHLLCDEPGIPIKC